MRIDGPGVFYLQYLFLSDWNFCCGKSVPPEALHVVKSNNHHDDVLVQVASSGPDSIQPSLLFPLLKTIFHARKEILITTPYFIPGGSILEAIRVAALSGIWV